MRYPKWSPLLLLVLLAACSDPASEPTSDPASPVAKVPGARPNVLLVTFDTTRPDSLSWVPGASPTASTPNLDALAEAGFRLPQAAAPVPVTLPSHTSMLSGLIPRRHGVRDNGQMVPGEFSVLPERLRAAGYSTAAFVSGFPLSRAFGLDRGFDHYDDQLPEGQGEQLERRADETTAAALTWLRSAARPWFLWVHFYDPHDPYEPPGGFAGDGSLRAAYDGEVQFADQAFGDLWNAARKVGGTELLTVFTADHGESLGEHGENTHGFFVYESTLAVPLVVHWPGRVSSGQSLAAARLVDVAPTVLDLLGLPSLEGVDGISLAPLLTGQDSEIEIPAAYLETQRPWISYGWAPLSAVRHDGWKWIAAPKPELYHLAEDPGESRNLVEEARPKARELQALLRAMEEQPVAIAEATEDPEVAARLRALGYTGAGSSRSQSEAPPGLPDPKDKIELWNLLGQGEERFSRGDFAGAVAIYEQVLGEEPSNRYALARSGMALVELGTSRTDRRQIAEGVTRLEAAVQADPRRAEARQGLALAYVRLGRLDAAAEELAELTRLQPRRSEHWLRLGAVLGQSGRAVDAAAAMAEAARLAPEDPATQIRWGFAAFGAGDADTAAQALLRGAELVSAEAGPEAFPHAGALGILLARSGRGEEARPWLLRCRPQEPEFAEARLELARLEAQRGDAAAARQALQEALRARPELQRQAAQDPVLSSFLQ